MDLKSGDMTFRHSREFLLLRTEKGGVIGTKPRQRKLCVAVNNRFFKQGV